MTSTIARREVRAAVLLTVLGSAFACNALAGDEGIYAIWHGKRYGVIDLPEIKGGQVYVEWQAVEPQQGRYDFSAMGRQLAEFSRREAKATVQINAGRRPDYLLHTVPYTDARLHRAIPAGVPSHMYWHDNYKKAYFALIRAAADYLRRSTHRRFILGVRLNFNAIRTEHMQVPARLREPAVWTVPGGVANGPPWSAVQKRRYMTEVVDAYRSAFVAPRADGAPPIRVFLRSQLFSTSLFATPQKRHEYEELLRGGQIGLFHTSSRVPPLRPWLERKYDVFRRHCAQTPCYAEAWKDAERMKGAKLSAVQWNYWRHLLDLHAGVSFIAVYYRDLRHLLAGGDGARREEDLQTYRFANLYAGAQRRPALSPGGWVALRGGNDARDDYTFLMRRMAARSGVPVLRESLEDRRLGPHTQRFGAWATMLSTGESMEFVLADALARALSGRHVEFRLIYLDDAQGALQVQAFGRRLSIDKRNSGRWETAVLEMKVDAAALDGSTPHVRIVAADGDSTVHMVEVRRAMP